MRYTGPSAAVLAVVKARNDGLCMRCSIRPGVLTHHRLPRGSGGTSNPDVNRPDNLVRLCIDCNEYVERRERRRAEAAGWLVRHGIDEPYQIPLTDLRGSVFFLSEEGGVIPIAGPGEPPF